MVTEPPNNTGLDQDSRFRENLRSQLQEKEAQWRAEQKQEELKRSMEDYRRQMESFQFFDPYASATLRWIGGVAGVLFLIIGVLWFLSLFGFVIPWYSAFPIILIVIGGSLVVAAIVTRKRNK